MVNDIQLAHPMVLYQCCYLRFSWFSGIAYQKYVSVIDLRILEVVALPPHSHIGYN